MNQPLTKEETDQLSHILSLLEVTYSCKDSGEIKNAQDELKTISSNLPFFTNLLIKSLLISSINGKPISLDLHKSVAIYLRNIILKNSNLLKPDEIYESMKNFTSIIFSWEKNINLSNNTITMIFQNIINFLLSLDVIKENAKIVESLFIDVSKILLDKNSPYITEKNILITCDKIIDLSRTLMMSKNIDFVVYEKFLNKYFFPIVDKIFDLAKNYINPQQNIYDNNYLSILKKLLECFYSVLVYFSTLKDQKNSVYMLFFKKYLKIYSELIGLSPPLDNKTLEKFEKPNPLVIFNVDENNCKEINLMKSKVMELLSYLIQNIFIISNDLEINKKKNENYDNELINFTIDLIKLIVKCFEDILSNKEKYFYIRDYETEISEDENSIYVLLYDLCVFLVRALIRDPFKNIIRSDIKLFLVNILLPLLSTNDTERNSIENDFDIYHDYFNDIIEQFKLKNFRASGMFLISKICYFFGDENHFLLSYFLEMFNYTINEGKINTKANYNIYLENKDKFTVDKLDNITKIDLFLLVILLLRDRISSNMLIKTHLRDLLIENQSKLHQINSLEIKIKICKMYSVFIPILFKEEENLTFSQKKNTDNFDINVTNKINDPSEKVKYKLIEEHYNFIKNGFEYLMNNISQNALQNPNNKDKNNYFQSLSHSAAETISELIISFKETTNEENEDENNMTKSDNTVIEYISKTLGENFKTIVNLIIYIDNPSFYNLIDYILEKIKPNDRQDIFICLENITQKFVKDFKNIEEQSNSTFIMEYFKIITDFLKGENKLNKNDQKEIEYFENILNKVCECININELENLEENDEFYEMIEKYMLLVENINIQSILIFKKVFTIIKKDKICNNSLFSFLCTFMKYLPKKKDLDVKIKSEIINEIIEIIKFSLTLEDEIFNNSVKHGLLLILKLFNISISDIPFNILQDLILNSMKALSPISKKELLEGDYSDKIVINQIVLANISLGFIFRPIDTFKIFFSKMSEKNEPKKDNTNNKENKEGYNPYLAVFINLILTDLGVATTDYIILLNKCIILGICSIFKEKYCLEELNKDMNIKILMIQIFAKLIEKHKNQQKEQLNKIMKKETNCNFIGESEFEEEEDEDDEELEDIKDTVHEILCENENIKNADEFKYFGQIINDLKATDSKTYESLNGSFNGRLEEMLKLRNININYKGKEFKVPRKTLKILKNKK